MILIVNNKNRVTTLQGIMEYTQLIRKVSLFLSLMAAVTVWYFAGKASSIGMYDGESVGDSCGIVIQTAANGQMKYLYTVEGSCTTPEEIATIQGALDKAHNIYTLNNYDGVHCMELTYNTKWIGYLLIGPTYEWPDKLRCDDDVSGTRVLG